MPDLATLTLPSGNTYSLKDAYARNLIAELFNFHAYLGVTTTPIEDNVTTSPVVVIAGESVTAVAGDCVTYETEEFVYSTTGVWQKYANLTGLGALAFKNTASGDFTPSGSVSQPTFTGEAMQSTGDFTPAGTISGGNVTLHTTQVNHITDAGEMPTYTVQGERLIISGGAVPSFEAVGVADAIDTVIQPTFVGTQNTVLVTGTPSGTVSKPTFTGTQGTVMVQ